MYIVNECKGKLPIRLRAAKEGLIIPTKNVLAVIENTDKNVPWLTTWIETPALRAIWYPTTVGTTSWYIKQEILHYLEISGDPLSIAFKLHDFGARGVSSLESAGIGGAAHLVNFMGTDTMSAVLHVMGTYGGDVCGFSIPAAEHSTITSWGRENEVEAYRNMLVSFARSGSVLAVVSDSYDIFNACKLWGTELKDEVVKSGATVVIRPDSGDPVVVVPRMLKILDEHFGSVKNAKGYKVLNNVRVIWGDGINNMSLSSILRTVVDVCGYSADNIAFGMGGALLGAPQRDDQQFAMKCSAICINGEWRDVFKEPATDSKKVSKKGRITLWESGGEYQTSVDKPTNWTDKGFEWVDAMETYFEDGNVVFTSTFQEVRDRSNK
jgi:nicotinamide phosphoribosyltransferase